MGFGAAVAPGSVESREKPGSTDGLEIMKKGEILTEDD